MSVKKNLDRHWRNARTAANHNPWVFKARIVGDYARERRDPAAGVVDRCGARQGGLGRETIRQKGVGRESFR